MALGSHASDLFLLLLTALLLPLSSSALIINYFYALVIPSNSFRRQLRRSRRFKPKNVLVTGVISPTGLRIARALYQTGHNVVGADTDIPVIFNPARLSKAFKRTYEIRSSRTVDGVASYIEDLLQIIRKEKIDLWIDAGRFVSSDENAQAKRVIEQQTKCRSWIADIETAHDFSGRSEFFTFVKRLGLPTPETHYIKSRDELHKILNSGQGQKRYALKTPDGSPVKAVRTILPKRSVSQTYQDISQLKITKSTPWVLEQYIESRQKYTAAAIVTNGMVKAFAASPSIDESVCYQSIPSDSGISQAMLQFVQSLAEEELTFVSCHISVDFCVDERATHSGVVQQLLPIDGRISADPCLLLFQGKSGAMDLTRAYLSGLPSSANGLTSYTGLPQPDLSDSISQPAKMDSGIYFLGADLKNLVVSPSIQVLTFKRDLSSFFRSFAVFFEHLFFWREGMYEFWDPVPIFWFYHVFMPVQILLRSVGRPNLGKAIEASKEL